MLSPDLIIRECLDVSEVIATTMQSELTKSMYCACDTSLILPRKTQQTPVVTPLGFPSPFFSRVMGKS